MIRARSPEMPLRMLSAHIGYLFTELPFVERLRAAGLAGFQGVEHPQPFDIDARVLRSELDAAGLSFSQLAAVSKGSVDGGKGLAAVQGQETRFREGLLRSIDYAVAIGCPFVHPMSGVPPAGSHIEKIRDTYFHNLQYAVEQAGRAGITILLEAISDTVVPGYFACNMDIVLDAVDQVAPGKILVLLDTFHARMGGWEMTHFIRRHPQLIGHIHVADFPGRHEPGTGSLDFLAILKELDQAEYRGAIGFEYTPTSVTEAGLGWLSDPIWSKPLADSLHT